MRRRAPGLGPRSQGSRPSVSTSGKVRTKQADFRRPAHAAIGAVSELLPRRRAGAAIVVIASPRTLAPGSYAYVTVEPGVVLTLVGGEYVVETLTVGAGAEVLVGAPSRLLTRTVSVGDHALIASTAASGSTVNLALIATDADAGGTPAIGVGSGVSISAFIGAAIAVRTALAG